MGNVITNAQVDAVGNVLMGSNCISAPMSKPVGGKLSAPVKKNSVCHKGMYQVFHRLKKNGFCHGHEIR